VLCRKSILAAGDVLQSKVMLMKHSSLQRANEDVRDPSGTPVQRVTCTMWASDLDQFDNTCADADGATGRAEISCPMSGPFHTCVSLPRDSPFTRVTHGPHGREAMRFVYRHGIPTSTCVKGASKSVCTTSVRNTARMQGSGQQAISEKEILDRFGHNYTRSAARLQLQKLP